MVGRVRCPNCKEKGARESDRELLGPEIKRKFECENCGHSWGKVI